MRTIWKHDLYVGVTLEQIWAPGTKIVHVAPVPGDNERVQFWVEHKPKMSGTGRRVKLRVFGTGHEIPDGWTHIGTAICGPFVWHLFAMYE